MQSRVGPDPELVRAAARREPRALDALISASLPLVYNIVGRALNGHADVDDVVQETLLRAIRYLPDLREPEAYRSWLVAIALRQVRDHEQVRRTAAARRADLADLDVPDAGSDFAGLTILRLGLTDQRREVAEATRWLGDEDQSLLALWWLEEAGELDRSELAQAMDLSGAHAAVRVARMKDQMQTARAVVRSLRAQPRCPTLNWSIAGWDGQPSPLWRKRIARHVRDCPTCAQRAGDMLPIERLLAGAGLLPVPAGLTDRFSNFLPVSHPPAASVSRLSRLLPSGTHAAIAAAAVVATVAGVIVIVQVSGHASTPSSAAMPVASVRPAVPLSQSPSASPSAKPKPTPKPSPSHAPAAPTHAASTPATSDRKGVSAWSFNGVGSALKQSGASWYYTWSTTHSGITTPHGVQFVPMIWGPGSVTTSALAQAKAAGGELLGFNEPDLASQSNMTVAQALKLWPKLEATGLKLGSPAVASGGATAGGWLDQFMTGAADRGYRVDFITLHWYGSDFTSAAA
ncbi:MAG TPA: sigma-70 family RNA polymerase sigma factor, partial [Micromonosporaceae bacterium]